MDKFAQKRSLLNQLREKINMPGAYLEGMFKPELDRVMTALKELDDRIRSELTGKRIGTSDSPEIQKSAKDILKEARTAFNRREYVTGIADLSEFHRKMKAITEDIDRFFVDVNKIHHRFLFEGVDEDKIRRLREYMEPKEASTSYNQLVKEAGLIETLLNFFSKRGRGLAAWEKYYPKETKLLRDGAQRLLDQADHVLADTISTLKKMATARATRRPDEYINLAQAIKNEFNKFDTGDRGFRSYYQNAIMPWMRIKDEIEAKQREEEQQPESEKPSEAIPLVTRLPAQQVPATEEAPITERTPTTPPMGGPPGALPPLAPATPAPSATPVPELAGPSQQATVPELELPQQQQQTKQLSLFPQAHQNFLESLESMSSENPAILSSYIAKYAATIQAKDPETAITLFALARKYKA